MMSMSVDGGMILVLSEKSVCGEENHGRSRRNSRNILQRGPQRSAPGGEIKA
jgi:hypothetical protein